VAALADWIRAEHPRPAPPSPALLDPSVTRGPLSFAQERLWFLAQFAPDSPAYNLPLVARVRGRLDHRALREATRWVIRRHESLRTRFSTDASEPIQQVVDPDRTEIDLVEHDVSAHADPQRAARDSVTADAFRPFAIVAGELPVRLLLVRVAADEHLFAMTVHHLVADGWAVGILVRDICRAYDAFAGGGAPDDIGPGTRYLDYAYAQRRADHGGLITGLDFWRDALAGAPYALSLPADHPRPAIRGQRGTSLPVELTAEQTTRLRSLAASTGCTEFMVLFAAFAAVLSRYSGQRDLIIGTPIANRTDPATESLVGLLANTVALRADLRDDPTARELLGRARTICLDAFAHQDTPFEQVVEHLSPERDPSRSPLFQIMLALNNAPPPELTLADLECVPVEPDNPTAKFDVVLNLSDQGGRISGRCEYDVDIYDGSMIAALMGHLVATLDHFVADPDRRMSDMTILTAAEWDEQISEFTAAPSDYAYDTTLHALVEAATDRDPQAVAVIAGADSVSLTYRQLDLAANRLAEQIIAAGVEIDDVVGVCAARSPALVVGQYAVLKAGATVLPIDPAWPAARTALILADAGCRTVLHDGEPADAGLPPAVTVLPCRIPDDAGPADRPRRAVTPATGAYIVYTSGSTGQPKGVLVAHEAICNNLLWMQRDWPLGSADRLLHKTANTFDVAVKEVFWPLLAGATLVLAVPGSQRDPVALLDQMDHHAVTITHFVPSMLDMLLDTAAQRQRPLSTSLRYVMCGAETMSVTTQHRFFAACDADLLHMYGPTETAIAVTGWTCQRGQPPVERVPLGRPMPNCGLYVLDDHLRPVPAQVWGSLYVGGAPLARGYLHRPGETAASFLPDPFDPARGSRMYRTGDVVRHRRDGLLEFLGRADGQVKVRGFRIELGEVEAALLGHPDVRQAAVVVRAAVQAEAHLVAYVVVTDDADPDGAAGRRIRDHLRDLLPAQMVPATVIVRDAMPLSENGKVDRSALAAESTLIRDVDTAYVAPRDDVEQAVADAWSQTLGVSPIGVYDDFFALGGHSLQAARIVAQLRDHFAREVSLRDVFAAPTVATVARLLREAPAPAPLPRITRRGEAYPAELSGRAER
jgi:amino acid adenylation domain-containing protein